MNGNHADKHLQGFCQTRCMTASRFEGTGAPALPLTASLLLLLRCVRQDCMLLLLELLPFSSSMLDRWRVSSSVLDRCV